MVTVPEVEVQLTVQNELNGIISKLKQTYSDDEIIANYATPSSIHDITGNSKELITWEYFRYMAGAGSASNYPWIQLYFPNGYIYPTAYSMRGNTNTPCFCKEWNVYGIHEGDINTEGNWELLGQNDTSQSIYCVKDSSSYCNDARVGTFTMKSMISNRGYKYIRWRSRRRMH